VTGRQGDHFGIEALHGVTQRNRRVWTDKVGEAFDGEAAVGPGEEHRGGEAEVGDEVAVGVGCAR
jgi:hypothetical protein